MRFAFTPDQLLLRDGLRAVLERECGPAVVRESWKSVETTSALWAVLARVGVAGLTVPEEHGGLGLGALEWVLLLEECGRFAAPVPLLDTVAIAVPVLSEVGTETLKRSWLPEIAAGKARAAVGLAESLYVLGAERAELLLLQRNDELHAVRRGDVTLEEVRSVDGSRRLSRVTWSPRRDTCIAEGETTRRAVEDARDRGALGTSAELLGLAHHMIDLAVDYAKVREQFGSPIGSFQAVKHALASALVKLEFARPAVYRAAHSLAKGDPARGIHVSIAKACASDAAQIAARAALQCHGAIGYSFEHDLHLWMKRAWALAASWGDAAWHRARVAAAILDAPARDGGEP